MHSHSFFKSIKNIALILVLLFGLAVENVFAQYGEIVTVANGALTLLYGPSTPQSGGYYPSEYPIIVSGSWRVAPSEPKIVYFLDGDGPWPGYLPQGNQAGVGSYFFTIGPLSPGTHKLKLVATAASGNSLYTGETEERIFYVMQSSELTGPGGISLTLSADQSGTIPFDTPVKFSWSSTNASSCRFIGTPSTDVPIVGSMVYTFSTYGTHPVTLLCQNATTTKQQTLNLTTANPLAPAVAVSVASTSILSGQNTRIYWDSSNAVACHATAGSWQLGLLPTSGNEIISPSRTTDHTITCQGFLGNTVSQTVTVVVKSPDQGIQPVQILQNAASTSLTSYLIDQFKKIVSSPQKAPSVELNVALNSGIYAEKNSFGTITWTSSDADRCEAKGDWSGKKTLSGTERIGPFDRGKTYSMTCSGPGGVDVDSINVQVRIPSPVLSFSADKASVKAEENLLLTWSSANSTFCKASGSWSGIRPVSGQEYVRPFPPGSKSYTFSCTGIDGKQTAKTISVNDEGSVQGTIIPRKLPEPVIIATTTKERVQTIRAARESGGETEKSGMNPLDPNIELFAEPPSVEAGQSTYLRWSASNVSECFARGSSSSDWFGQKELSGEATSTPLNEDTTFSLLCSGSKGSIAQSVSVAVIGGSIATSSEIVIETPILPHKETKIEMFFSLLSDLKDSFFNLFKF